MPEELNVLHNPANLSGRRVTRIAASVGIVLFCGLAVYLFVKGVPWAGKARPLPASSQLDLKAQFVIDPELLRYQLKGQAVLSLADPIDIAVGPGDEIYVANSQAIYAIADDGRVKATVLVNSPPTCLGVGGPDHSSPGRLYAGSSRGVEVFGADGERVATWPPPNQQAVLTSIAVAAEDVFLADAGNHVVWRYNVAGEQIGRIDLNDEAGQKGGFAVPGRAFDVVVAANDLLYVTNPGKLQVVAVTFAGDRGAAWGRATMSIEGFFGCCNPTHLALLPDGRIVSCEKGIPRVKVYRTTGELDAVVAGPEHLGVSLQSIGDPRLADKHAGFTIATDSRGRVLVLDRVNHSVRIFVSKDATGRAGGRS